MATHHRHAPRSSVIAALLVGLLAVSISAILVVWCHAPAGVIGMYRLYITVLMMAPFVWRHRALIGQIALREWLMLILSGVFLGLHFLFWMSSLKMTSVASSMIITTLEPVFVMVGAFFCFRERLHRLGYISMGIAMLGAALVGISDAGGTPAAFSGDLYSLLGTVAVAVYMLAGQNVRQKMPATVYSTIVFFVAGTVLLTANLLTNAPLYGYTGHTMLLFILLAIIPTLLGHALFNWLLAYVSASTISVTVLGEPIVAIVLAAILLGEPLNGMQAVGGAVCIAGVWLFLHVKQSANRRSR